MDNTNDLGQASANDDQPRKVISASKVSEQLDVSLRTLQRWVREGRFPVPVKLGPARIGFYQVEVEAWLATLPRTREAA